MVYNGGIKRRLIGARDKDKGRIVIGRLMGVCVCEWVYSRWDSCDQFSFGSVWGFGKSEGMCVCIDAR